MTDEIKKRLQETSEHCFKTYETWRGNEKDNEAREALLDSIHEIRKVASRLEIELAISERDQMAQKPIPIPPHRDAKRKQSGDNGDRQPDFDEDGNPIKPKKSQGQRRKGGQKKASQGRD